MLNRLRRSKPERTSSSPPSPFLVDPLELAVHDLHVLEGALEIHVLSRTFEENFSSSYRLAEELPAP
jgi:hypothetical protein